MIKWLIALSAFYIAGINTCNNKEFPSGFQPDWEAGDQFYYKRDIDTKSRILYGRETYDIEEKLMYVRQFEAIPPNSNAAYSLKSSISDLRFQSGTASVSMRFDAQAIDPNGKLTPALESLLNYPIVYQLDSSGHVLAVENAAAMEEDMFASLKSPTDASIKQALSYYFNAQAIHREMSHFIAPFPHTLSAKNKTWKQSDTLSFVSDLTRDATYRLINIKDEIAEISMDATLSTDPEIGKTIGWLHIRSDLNGSCKGSLFVNVKSGMIERSALQIVLSGTMYTANIQVEQKATPYKMEVESTHITTRINERKL